MTAFIRAIGRVPILAAINQGLYNGKYVLAEDSQNAEERSIQLCVKRRSHHRKTQA
jgi:hypothetical protein